MPVVVSKQIHKFGPKIYKKGAKLTVTDREAKWLVALGRATIEVEAAPEPPVLKVTRPYKRKDIQTAPRLVVESAHVVPEQVPEVPAFKWPARDEGE